MKSGNTILIVLIIILIFILVFMAWLILPKSNFSTSGSTNGGGGGFGQFKRGDSKAVNSSVPETLRWNDTFKKDDDIGKKPERRGSYLHYLSEQNNSKKK